MFIGHQAVAFAAKRYAPRTSLGTLTAAVLFLDLLWPIFLLLGWETVRVDSGNTAFTPLDFVSYPWSHSLAMTIVWATLFAGVYHALTRYRPGAIWVWIGVASHWVLDVFSHRPDMPLAPGVATRVGLGVWNSIPLTLIVEGAMFYAAVWLYIKQTRPTDKIGVYGFWSFIVVLILMYLSGLFSPPPPDSKSLALFANGAWLLVLWAWWFDRHRVPRR